MVKRLPRVDLVLRVFCGLFLNILGGIVHDGGESGGWSVTGRTATVRESRQRKVQGTISTFIINFTHFNTVSLSVRFLLLPNVFRSRELSRMLQTLISAYSTPSRHVSQSLGRALKLKVGSWTLREILSGVLLQLSWEQLAVSLGYRLSARIRMPTPNRPVGPAVPPYGRDPALGWLVGE